MWLLALEVLIPRKLFDRWDQKSMEIGPQTRIIVERQSELIYRSVSHIRPPFCKLSASRKCRGAYMRNLTFNLANTPLLPVPRLDVDIGTLYYRPIEAADLPSLLILSSPEPQKLDGQDRLTEAGHSIDSVFQAFRGFVLSICC